MRKWKALLSLMLLFFVFSGVAQDSEFKPAFNTFSLSSNNADKSILKSTESSSSLSMLLAILKASELDEILDYDGEFTVFAPSNDAFGKLSATTLQFIFDPNNVALAKELVSYHIIAGKLTASRILRGLCQGHGITSFTTIQGKKLYAYMRGIDIILTDNSGKEAMITTADINRSNGVIHEIDTVFIP